ncbi:MAG: hypothetical protein ACRDJP_14510 [Actinomycetota bacterium]
MHGVDVMVDVDGLGRGPQRLARHQAAEDPPARPDRRIGPDERVVADPFELEQPEEALS